MSAPGMNNASDEAPYADTYYNFRKASLYEYLSYSYMQSAGFSEMRTHPLIQNLAKVPELRYQAEYPHFVYSMLN
jgi:hypothetical protein